MCRNYFWDEDSTNVLFLIISFLVTSLFIYYYFSMIENLLYSDNRTNVTFSMDFADNIFRHTESVYVSGSFTKWKHEADFDMNREKSLWTLTVPTSLVSVPGNSGYPEYNYTITYRVLGLIRKKKCITADVFVNKVKLLQNFILPPAEGFRDDELDRIRHADKRACTIKKLSEYDFNKIQDTMDISNFRRVPGTSSLFRGYHPYKKSRPHLDTEVKRIFYVNKNLELNKVRSIITLCGKENLDKSNKESVTPYVKKIQEENNQCFIDTSYEIVYFDSRSKEFSDTVYFICNFIQEHPSPFYIHCRLGSDRTGTMSSVLAALCGASWQEIAEDYERTGNMGIGEYRNRKLLSFMFEQLLGGKKPEELPDFNDRVKNYFISNNILTEEMIDCVKNKLK